MPNAIQLISEIVFLYSEKPSVLKLKFVVFLVPVFMISFCGTSQQPELVFPLQHTETITSIDISPDRKFLATASEDRTVKIWDRVSGNMLKNYINLSRNPVSAVCFDPESKYILVSTGDGTSIEISLFDDKRILFSSSEQMHFLDAAVSSGYSLNGDYIIQVLNDYDLLIWDALSKELLIEKTMDQPVSSYEGIISEDGVELELNQNRLVIQDNNTTDSVFIKNLFTVNNKLTVDKTVYAVDSLTRRSVIRSGTNHEKGKTLTYTNENNISFDSLFSIAGKPLKESFERIPVPYSENQFPGTVYKVVSENNDSLLVAYRNRGMGRTYELLVYRNNLQTEPVFQTPLRGNQFDYVFNKMIWSPETKKLYILYNEAGILVLDLKKNKLEQFVPGQDFDQFDDLRFLSGNKMIISSSVSGKFNLYTLDTEGNTGLTARGRAFAGGFIIVLPDHYYYCTKADLSALHYVTPDLKIISLDQLDLRFNRPDKILQALGIPDTALIGSYRKAWEKRIRRLGIDSSLFGKNFQVPAADIINREQISYEQKNNKLNIHIRGTDSSYQLRSMNVWINDNPVFGKKGVRLFRQQTIDTIITLTLSQGENTIEAGIMNENGTESYRNPLLVRHTSEKTGPVMTRFIGIGIDRFADSSYNLQYSVKDIRDLAQKLKEKYGKHIIMDTLFNEQVTVQNIKSLKQKLLNTSVDDKVIISYSGHGLLNAGYDYFLSAYAVQFNQPEKNGLPYEELENLLDSIPARKKLLLIDACHSGEVDKEDLVRLNQSPAGLVKGIKPVAYKHNGNLGLKNSFQLMQSLFVHVGQSTGASIISAAAGSQFALERSDLKNGVFTYAILEAMKQHSTISVGRLKQIVSRRVAELTNGLQQPTTRNESLVMVWNLW